MAAESSPVRIAVVGMGYGRNHVAEIERLRAAGRAVELVAVVDPVAPGDIPSLADAPQLPAILAVPHLRSLGELIAGGDVPDIITLATPIHTHMTLGVQALEAGAHVLLEKPPTATLAEFEELRHAVERTGRSAQIGFQARGGGGLTAAREAIASGEIGEVEGIGAVGTWVRPRSYYRRAAWAGRRTMDGRTVMDGVATNPLAHAVDIALALDGSFTTGDVRDVAVDAWHAHDIEADDTTSLVIHTARGTTIGAGLTVCGPVAGLPPVVTVRGSAGEIRLRYSVDQLEIETPDGVRQQTFDRTGSLENLVQHVADGAELFAPVASTGAFMRVLEAVRLSHAPLPVPPGAVTWQGEGDDAHAVITDVDTWCERAAREGATFSELGAPWTR